jgi:voltage-gated potassium channel
MESLRKRTVKALVPVVVSITIGTVGFWVLDEGRHSVIDCAFMTVITLATVGYREVIPLNDAGKVFASLLIVMGMGSLIYFGSTLIAFFVEFDIRQIRRKKKMQKNIERLSGHVIVCGVGTTGARVVQELMDTQTPFVMIDTMENQLKAVCEVEGKILEDVLFIHGDATEDRILDRAGIDRASGLVSALRNDKDNLYLILSARQINPKLRIVARATERDAPQKMLRAGADKVVAPNILGGMRIASEIIRPDVVEFLDIMLRDEEEKTRFEQVALPHDSPLLGKKLSDTEISNATDVLVIAIRDGDGNFIYNPAPETVISVGAVLVVLGAMESVIRLRNSVADDSASPLPANRPSAASNDKIDG